MKLSNESTYPFPNIQDDLIENEEAETVSLAGFQVTKAELFAHTREPAVTVWDNRIKFNMIF